MKGACPHRARLSDSLRDFVHFLVTQLEATVVKLQFWHVCLDEVLFRELQRFLTVLSDAETGRALA